MRCLRIEVGLYLLETLVKEGSVDKEEIIAKFTISSATFKRSISDLRCYFTENDPEYELSYDSKLKRYVLKSVHV